VIAPEVGRQEKKKGSIWEIDKTPGKGCRKTRSIEDPCVLWKNRDQRSKENPKRVYNGLPKSCLKQGSSFRRSGESRERSITNGVIFNGEAEIGGG